MTSMLSFLKTRKDDRRDDRTSRRRSKFQPALDGLEKREVLSTTIQQYGEVVRIVAEGAEDHTVNVVQQDSQVNLRINGIDHLYAAGSINGVIFDATHTTAGTTQTFINDTSLICQGYGGDGINRFVAGHSFDYFCGGGGTNQFEARDGYVVFFGAGESNEFTLGSGSGFIMSSSKTTKVNSPSTQYFVWLQ